MSIKLMSVCWEKQFQQRSDREVMLVLCDHANDDGICWPSRGLVEWKTDLSEQTLKKVYARLKAANALEVVAREEGGRGRVPILRINPHALPDKPPRERGEPDIPLFDNKGGKLVTKGGNSVSKGGNSVAPEPPLESSGEPLLLLDTTLIDDVTTRCLLLLRKVEGFPTDDTETATYLMELREEFPSVDHEQVCREYEIWHEDNPGKTKNYRLRLRNFFKSASERDALVVNGGGARRNGNHRDGSRDYGPPDGLTWGSLTNRRSAK